MMSKPKWEKEMEEYINGMTEEAFRDFLEDTGYEFYKNVRTPLMGLKELDSLDDPLPINPPYSGHTQPSIWLDYDHIVKLEFDKNVKSPMLSPIDVENVVFDESSSWLFASWDSLNDVDAYPWRPVNEVDFRTAFQGVSCAVICSDIRMLSVKDDEVEYELAA